MERTDTQRPMTPEPRASFDPEAPGFLEDPYAHYRRLREQDPVHRTPFGYWVVSRYADVSAMLRDPRFGKAFGGLAAAPMAVARGGAGSALVEEMSRWILFRDPPDHTRLRGLATKAFTPRVVGRMRPRIQAVVDELLDRVADDGRMDVIADFAFPLPVTVITEILGLSTGEAERCRAWTVAVARTLDPTQTPEHLAQATAAVVEISEYVRSRVADRRGKPGEGLLAALMGAEEGGGRLSEEELISTVNLLFAAGHETTVNLIGNGLLALLQNRDQLCKLRTDPALVPHAIEELLRFDSPVQLARRWAREDVEVRGTEIAAGDELVLLIGAANRDPDQFPHPDALDVCRTEVRHLSFGGGPHFCLGAMLARLEAEIAISTLIRRFPSVELAGGAIDWREHAALRGLRSLPVRFAPRCPRLRGGCGDA